MYNCLTAFRDKPHSIFTSLASLKKADLTYEVRVARYYLKLTNRSNHIPSYCTNSLGSITPWLFGSFKLIVLAFFPLVKYISLVLIKSNLINSLDLSLYSLYTSFSRAIIFFLKLVDEVTRAISSK